MVDEVRATCRTGVYGLRLGGIPARITWPFGRLVVTDDALTIEGLGMWFFALVTGRPRRLVIPARQIRRLRQDGAHRWMVHLTDQVHGTIRWHGPSVVPTLNAFGARHHSTVLPPTDTRGRW